MSLDIMLKRLGLSTVESILPELTPIAEKEAWSYSQFLERLISEEIAQRSEHRVATHVAKAKFPFHATIETFDFTFKSDLKRQMLGRFLGPELISEHRLVDQRYLKGKPILFTTNKPLQHWGRVLHDQELAHAIVDRTLHYGDYIKLAGPSYRLKGRKVDLDHPAISERSTATQGGDSKPEH